MPLLERKFWRSKRIWIIISFWPLPAGPTLLRNICSPATLILSDKHLSERALRTFRLYKKSSFLIRIWIGDLNFADGKQNKEGWTMEKWKDMLFSDSLHCALNQKK